MATEGKLSIRNEGSQAASDCGAMLRFSETCELIAATTKKLEKTAIVAAYLQSLLEAELDGNALGHAPGRRLAEAAAAVIFLSGRPFPAYEDSTLQVGGALLWRVIEQLSKKSSAELSEIYRQHGDTGSVAAAALPAKKESDLSLVEVQAAFHEIAAASGTEPKTFLLGKLLARAGPLEAKYIVKIISGDLRIGLKESLVEEAIARAFAAPLDQVKRANMLLGDIGETLRLAAAGKLGEARFRLFHPIDLMLASPVESAAEALSYFQNAAVEDKYDGIRAQLHCGHGQVRLFSRTRDEITASFPELTNGFAGPQVEAIFDGEIVAWNSGDAAVPARALPFSALQQRLGRKKVSPKLMREIPIAYLVFDVLYVDGELLLDRPLHERADILNRLMKWFAATDISHTDERGQAMTGQRGDATGPVTAAPVITSLNNSRQSLFAFAATDHPRAAIVRAPVAKANSPEDIEALFTSARERGNEGLMIKDLDSLYTPGRRGKSWLKMKRELATLDVVVTAVEYGHGKRIAVLSDYTFAVWDGERLVNIGKAYSGLTDTEIAEMTKWFLAHAVSENGLRLEVEPKIVLEVAFNNMMRSTRHESGYALRFPRIVRLRPDKLPEDADTIETVEEIYNREHGE